MAAAASSMAPELAAALMPDESASAYLRRSAPLPVRTGLWFAPALRPGQAVEFVGPSGSGKTALLVQAAADALSRGEPVLLIDADATFDVERLAAALRARFRHLRGGEGGRRSEEEGEAEAEPLVAAALSRFGLLKCHSALELLSALVTLRASIERLERSVSEDGNNDQRVRLVLLDNVAAFYWPLRAAAASSSSSSAAAAAARRQQQTPHQQQQRLTLSTMAAAAARALKRALRGSGAAALVTRHAVFPIGPPSSYPSAVSAAASSGGKERAGGGGGSGGGTLREFFPAPWLSLASRRADLAPLAFAASAGGSAAAAPRVRLTWRASARGAGGGGDAAPPPPLLFELTDAGLVPL